MASLFAHAVLPVALRGAVAVPKALERRVLVAAVLLSSLPDLDVLTFAFQVHPTAMWGHGGISHSFFGAAVATLATVFLFFRNLPRALRDRVALFLFSCCASHGLLDAATNEEVGVALLAPFSEARMFLPLKVIPSIQLGLEEFLGLWGILTVANEIVYVVLPAALVVALLRERQRRRAFVQAAVWATTVVALRILLPTWFAATLPRPLRAMGGVDEGDPKDLPNSDLPEQKLVTRWGELRALHLLDADLAPANAPWSSTFFPSWFGGEAGRWQQWAPTLVWRTLFGFSAPSADEAKGWDDAGIFMLAPVEKVDLAFGRLDFPATVQGLAHSHNKRHPRYWSGRCNGIATASLHQPEPFRTVDVIGKDGRRVRFHPNDVKSLLSVAYYEPEAVVYVGDFCRYVSFDAGAKCSMNPAVLVLAIANRIGLAKGSFLVDAHPTIAKQYYAVAGAKIRTHGESKMIAPSRELAGKAVTTAFVSIDLVLSSTTLSFAPANVQTSDPSRYARVGLVPVSFTYEAEIALDENGTIVGGRWTGSTGNGPDNVVIISGGPKLTGENLFAADQIPWWFVEALAKASVDEGPAVPSVDLRTREPSPPP